MNIPLQNNVTAFSDAMEHLTAEMEVLRRGFARKAEVVSRRFEADISRDFRGYGITPAEAFDHIRKADSAACTENCFSDPDLIEIVRKRIDASLRQGMTLPLIRIVQLFGLSRFETDILLACLLPEFYPGFSRVYGFLQDDATLLYPTMGFLMECFCEDARDCAPAWRSFHASSPLIKWNILVPIGDESQTPPRKRQYRVDERIVSYLIGSDLYDGRLEGIIDLYKPGSSDYEGQYTALLEDILQGIIDGRECQFISLSGDKARMDRFMHSAARRLGWKVMKLSASSLFRRNDLNSKLLDVILREALLQPAIIDIHDEDSAASESFDSGPLLDSFTRRGVAVFYHGSRIKTNESISQNLHYLKLHFDPPSTIERLAYWKEIISEHNLSWPEHVIEQCAMKYQISKEELQKLFSRIKFDADNGNGNAMKSVERFNRSITDYIRNPLDSLSSRIETVFCWDDLVLPKPVVEHLTAFRSRIAYQFKVYEEWGFGRKLPRGRGVTALFSGPSGTGKTMAAEVIANDLGINLYRIDLAGLVSKYIGETEKNIKKIFDNAHGNVLLFFDEADALFGRRTEIKDSHDRYANLEVNYLLQRLEQHEGPVILATNMRKNLDEAFLRRIHFIIEFPVPSEPLRQILFSKYLAPGIPRAEDLDLNILSKHFEVTGGDIKNAVLQAAFSAAENSGRLEMEHLVMALKRECLKLGKHFPGDQLNHLCKKAVDSPENRRLRKGAAAWKSS